jgi:hypothetical protein
MFREGSWTNVQTVLQQQLHLPAMSVSGTAYNDLQLAIELVKMVTKR